MLRSVFNRQRLLTRFSHNIYNNDKSFKSPRRKHILTSGLASKRRQMKIISIKQANVSYNNFKLWLEILLGSSLLGLYGYAEYKFYTYDESNDPTLLHIKKYERLVNYCKTNFKDSSYVYTLNLTKNDLCCVNKNTSLLVLTKINDRSKINNESKIVIDTKNATYTGIGLKIAKIIIIDTNKTNYGFINDDIAVDYAQIKDNTIIYAFNNILSVAPANVNVFTNPTRALVDTLLCQDAIRYPHSHWMPDGTRVLIYNIVPRMYNATFGFMISFEQFKIRLYGKEYATPLLFPSIIIF